MSLRNGNDGSLQSIDGEYLPAAPGEGKRRRFRLTDARGIRRELAGMYSEFRNGQIDGNTARTAAFVLRCLLESIRVDEIEKRLTDLERKSQ